MSGRQETDEIHFVMWNSFFFLSLHCCRLTLLCELKSAKMQKFCFSFRGWSLLPSFVGRLVSSGTAKCFIVVFFWEFPTFSNLFLFCLEKLLRFVIYCCFLFWFCWYYEQTWTCCLRSLKLKSHRRKLLNGNFGLFCVNFKSFLGKAIKIIDEVLVGVDNMKKM